MGEDVEPGALSTTDSIQDLLGTGPAGMLQVQEMGCDHRVLKCQQNSKQVGRFLQVLAPARDMCLEEGKINSIGHSVEVQPCKGVDGT